MRSCTIMLVFCAGAGLAVAEDSREIERRIIEYVKANLEPGKRLVVSDLSNEVFTSPEERKVLSKLYSSFFRIPLFLVEHQAREGRLPTLEEIAGQFDFYGPEEADVVLRVMESDPRVPRFIVRDSGSGELVDIDVEKIKADDRFNQLVERVISGWEGQPAPAIEGIGFDGETARLADFRGQTVLLYVWFTNCPPCVRITPELAELHRDYVDENFTVLGINADRILGLPYDDAARAEYLKQHGVGFPNLHMTEETRKELHNVNIFPTLLLIDAEGTVVKHYVNYQPRQVVEDALQSILPATATSSCR